MTTAPPAAQRRGPLRWLSPWFAAYALAGLLVNGMVPVMLPVTVKPAGAIAVAVVVASFFVGQLTAPLIGGLADRRGWQRPLFIAAYPVMAASAVAIGVGGSIAVWIPAAFVAGAAAGAAQTLGSVFIVEGHPKSEWDTRIGWFRLTFGIGQVGGLAIGAVFADGDLTAGWLVAAGAILLGTVLGRWRLPHVTSKPQLAATPAASPAAPAQKHGLASVFRSRFGVFLLSWLLAMIAVQTILNVMPLVMSDAFGLRASTTATAYLAGSIVGALLYPVCGAIARRRSAAFVLGIGMFVTLGAFAVLSIAFLTDMPGKDAVGICGILILAVGYPFDYIGATLLAAELTPDDEGSAMGLFNSAVAAGAVVGALVPAWVAHSVGYGPFLPISAVVMVLAIGAGAPILFGRARRQAG